MRRLQAGEAVPDFRVRSIRGDTISPASLEGAPTLLAFHRYARCAVCNERIRELRSIVPPLRARTGLRVVFVCHSSPERLADEFGPVDLPFAVVPDPDRVLYSAFGVATSLVRTLRALSLATIVRARRSFPSDGKPAGLERPLTVIPADFFVDAMGTIVSAHYGEFLGDTWPADTIERLAVEHTS